MKVIGYVLIFIIFACSITNPILNLNVKLEINKATKIFDNLTLENKGFITMKKKLIFSCWIKYFKITKKDYENIFIKIKNNQLLLKSKLEENFFINPKLFKKLKDNSINSSKNLLQNKNKQKFDKNFFKIFLFNDAIHFITDDEVNILN